MDTSTPASASVILSGCARLIAEPSWQFESLISLPVRAERAGEAEVRVLWVTTTSPANIHLDGNQTPEDKNGVIENRDDYVFTFNCIVIETETPDPTSTVPPPVTPEPEGTAITTGGDGGTGESTVEVTVLILGGERYPIAQFRIGANILQAFNRGQQAQNVCANLVQACGRVSGYLQTEAIATTLLLK